MQHLHCTEYRKLEYEKSRQIGFTVNAYRYVTQRYQFSKSIWRKNLKSQYFVKSISIMHFSLTIFRQKFREINIFVKKSYYTLISRFFLFESEFVFFTQYFRKELYCKLIWRNIIQVNFSIFHSAHPEHYVSVQNVNV